MTCYRGSPRGNKKGGCEGHKKGEETEKLSFDFVVWETPQKITRREKLKNIGEPALEAAVTFTCGGRAASRRRRPRSWAGRRDHRRALRPRAAGRQAEWRRAPRSSAGRRAQRQRAPRQGGGERHTEWRKRRSRRLRRPRSLTAARRRAQLPPAPDHACLLFI